MNVTLNNKGADEKTGRTGTMVIEIPTYAPTASKGGKLALIANSGGFQPQTVQIDGKNVKVNVCAGIPVA
jgi:hypothetical protein